MKYLLLAIYYLLFACQSISFAQKNTTPTYNLTTEEDLKIKKDIEKELYNFKNVLAKTATPAICREFMADTFAIEYAMRKYIDNDVSTMGMCSAVYYAATQYDSLLNKYYKSVLSKLKPEDKKIFISAEKAWITFKDNEIKLIPAISKTEYSGGGTMQQIVNVGRYLEIIKNRAITLYNYYLTITQTY